jgi:hypothetical protein
MGGFRGVPMARLNIHSLSRRSLEPLYFSTAPLADAFS